ncbi:MAG: hypothetical protein WC654_04360 [Patescibacteria group bacterium]
MMKRDDMTCGNCLKAEDFMTELRQCRAGNYIENVELAFFCWSGLWEWTPPGMTEPILLTRERGEK